MPIPRASLPFPSLANSRMLQFQFQFQSQLACAPLLSIEPSKGPRSEESRIAVHGPPHTFVSLPNNLVVRYDISAASSRNRTLKVRPCRSRRNVLLFRIENKLCLSADFCWMMRGRVEDGKRRKGGRFQRESRPEIRGASSTATYTRTVSRKCECSSLYVCTEGVAPWR